MHILRGHQPLVDTYKPSVLWACETSSRSLPHTSLMDVLCGCGGGRHSSKNECLGNLREAIHLHRTLPSPVSIENLLFCCCIWIPSWDAICRCGSPFYLRTRLARGGDRNSDLPLYLKIFRDIIFLSYSYIFVPSHHQYSPDRGFTT